MSDRIELLKTLAFLMKPEIKVGDYVVVNFHQAALTLGTSLKVLAIPQATGDSWQFHDEASGAIHYISEGCTITKLSDQ